MAINKIDYYGEVLIDLSTDTLEDASQIQEGVVGHLKDGSVVVGTMTAGDDSPVGVYEDDEGNIVISGSVGVVSITDAELESAVADLLYIIGEVGENEP